MSARNQKRRNNYHGSTENGSESIVSPVLEQNVDLGEPDVVVAGPSSAKSPRIASSTLESLRASLKEKITSEIKGLLVESQKEALRLLKPKTRENENDEIGRTSESEQRNVCTPTRSVRINSILNNDPDLSRTTHWEIL